MEYLLRILLSAVVITAVSEIAKRQSLLAAVVAALPWISVVSFFWLYQDTHAADKVAKLSINVFWMVIPSLVFFPVLAVLLKHQVNFYWSMLLSMAIMGSAYLSVIKILSIIR